MSSSRNSTFAASPYGRRGLFNVSRCARAKEYLDSDLGSGDLNGA